MGFFRATLLRVSCTLHPDLPCDPCCRAAFYFSAWAVLFGANSLVFVSLCTVSADPFLSHSSLASVFWCGLPCSVFAPVSNLAPSGRMIYIAGRGLYRSAHVVPLQFVRLIVYFHRFFVLEPFLSHAELPAHHSVSCGRTPIATGQVYWRTAPF